MQVLVRVEDENDNSPQFERPHIGIGINSGQSLKKSNEISLDCNQNMTACKISIKENNPPNLLLAQLIAKDQDAG